MKTCSNGFKKMDDVQDANSQGSLGLWTPNLLTLVVLV